LVDMKGRCPAMSNRRRADCSKESPGAKKEKELKKVRLEKVMQKEGKKELRN